jgi:hypothetical protein
VIWEALLTCGDDLAYLRAMAVWRGSRNIPDDIGVYRGLILWNSLWGEFISIPKEAIRAKPE